MKCPICGSRIHPGADRCFDCGCHVRTHAHSADPECDPAPRPRRRRGCLLLPLLGLLPVLAIIVFSSMIAFSEHTYQESAVPEPGHTVTVPSDDVPASVPQADEGCFSISDGAVTFLPWCWDGSPVVRVPDTVDGRTVTALAEGCFSGCDTLTTIILPDTIVTVGPEAFSGCRELRGLFLPDGTKTVGRDAFAGCLALEALYVPASVQSMAQECLSDCPGLLYIFYDGTFGEWNALYDTFVSPFTIAICHDGSYHHGTGR